MINLLEKLFPTSLDHLPKEISNEPGPKPLFVKDLNSLFEIVINYGAFFEEKAVT